LKKGNTNNSIDKKEEYLKLMIDDYITLELMILV